MTSLDPRLAALYDVDNPGGRDHDWFRALADRLDARTIVDLGCGTGPLTASLAGPDRRIIGVDVTFEAHNVFEGTGEHLVYVETLAFRDVGQMTDDLKSAGFIVAQVWGGWSQQRPSADSVC